VSVAARPAYVHSEHTKLHVAIADQDSIHEDLRAPRVKMMYAPLSEHQKPYLCDRRCSGRHEVNIC
jgi:hypothetical protein